MADETSNAVVESDITQTVSDGINSLDPKEGEEQFPLHRANKNFNVSLSSEYLFRELTSLVPVPLDSDDEETSPFHESIVHTCTIAHRDEERLLSATKGQGVLGNKPKLIQFFGSLFSKKRNSKRENFDDEKSGVNLECKRNYSTDKDFLVGKVGDKKKVSGKQHSKLILSCFRKQ